MIGVTGDTLLSINTVTQAATIAAGATLQLAVGDTSSVTFNASTGDLILDHSSLFTGQINGFTGNGTLSGSDQIDLQDVNYSSASESYSNGVLTVTDGTDTAKLTFNGSYVLANFSLASDGNGGTIVVDPPLAGESGGSLDQRVALLSQYMASAFPAGTGAASAVRDSSELGIGVVPQLASPTPSQQHAAMLS